MLLTPQDKGAFVVPFGRAAHCFDPWALQLVKAISCFSSWAACIAPSDAVRATKSNGCNAEPHRKTKTEGKF